MIINSQSHLAAENVNRRPADENKRQMNIIHLTIGCFHDQRKNNQNSIITGQFPYKQLSIILANTNWSRKYRVCANPEKNSGGGGSDGCLPGVDRELGESEGLFR